jgi:hypothetical protein
MQIIYIKGDDKFIVSLCRKDKNKVWISKGDGEGGQFDADALSDALFDAVEKFYNDNF